MKINRNKLLIGLSILLALYITSCNKDGIYKPGNKISKIYREQEGVKVLSEKWIWNKNLLTKIEYFDNVNMYDKFEYTNKQLTKVSAFSDAKEVAYYILSYNKSLLKTIQLFSDGNLFQKMDVVHDGKKISNITITEYSFIMMNPQKTKRINSTVSNLMSFFIPIHNLTDVSLQYHKAAEHTYTIKFIYNGNNVNSISYSDGENDYTENYTYDAFKNPFYNALFMGQTSAFTFSENNLLTASTSSLMGGQIITKTHFYSYIYEGKYPIKCISTFSIMGDNAVDKIQYYEYLD